jgi:hypothetical protein
MKNKRLDVGRVWKQLEDDVVPQLRLSVIDRAVYSHLLRHSRLEGKPRICFSLFWLAKGTRLCVGTTRKALYRLFDHGTLRLVECAKSGHVVHVRLPEEVPGVRVSKIAAVRIVPAVNLEGADFLQTAALRRAIHEREGMINAILDKCVVEQADQCLPNAQELLGWTDEALGVIIRGGQILREGVPRPCRICGKGFYRPVVFPQVPNAVPGLRLWLSGSEIVSLPVSPLACDYCGNLEFFKSH